MVSSEGSAMADDDRREVGLGMSSRGESGGRVALIVEGAAAIGAVLADSLAALGWQTVVAHGPEDAGRLAVEHAFDLLVTDVALGTTSGGSLAADLIRHKARPVVLVSDLSDPGGIELWPPTTFRPTVHSLDTLFAAIGALFGHWDEPVRQAARTDG
jgi:NAD(P)-dependent dehydrogenase (short-subunit alcohol dehydrogenase family)